MAFIGEGDGTTYLEELKDSSVSFTEEEIQKLKQISEEIGYL